MILKKSFLLLASLLPLALSHCGKSDNSSAPALPDWNYGRITGRSASGKEIPTTTVLECRKKGDSAITYVYQVIANTRDVSTSHNDGEDEVTTYPNAEISLQASSSTAADSNKYLLNGDVELKAIKKKYAHPKFEIRATHDLVWRASEYYPLFSDVKDGDLLLRIETEGTWRLHEGGRDLPGVAKGGFFECNSHPGS